jgi:hypothetical protein
MNRFASRLPQRLTYLAAILSVAAFAIGCHLGAHDCTNCHVDNCSDIPQGAIPMPVGTFVRAWGARQADKAEIDDFVIYTNEWSYDDPLVLGPYGTKHLARIASRMPTTPYPVILQPDDDRQLNEKRRAVAINNLTALGIPDAAPRVVIHYPEAEGLFGDEAEPKYQRMLQPRTTGGGYLGGAGGGFLGGYGSFSGAGTGSFSGTYGSFSGGFTGYR